MLPLSHYSLQHSSVLWVILSFFEVAVPLIRSEASFQTPLQEFPTKQNITKYFFSIFPSGKNSEVKYNYIHIHNWSFNTLAWFIDLVSHTTNVVCVHLMHKWSFWETFHGNLFTLRVFAGNLLRGNLRSNTFCILFWCLTWSSNPGFRSTKPTHYLLV